MTKEGHLMTLTASRALWPHFCHACWMASPAKRNTTLLYSFRRQTTQGNVVPAQSVRLTTQDEVYNQQSTAMTRPDSGNNAAMDSVRPAESEQSTDPSPYPNPTPIPLCIGT